MYTKKRRHQTKGGRLLSLFRRKSVKSTRGEMKNIVDKIEKIKLKDVKSDFSSKIADLEKSRETCIDECIGKCTDAEMCKQLKHMIRTKPENEWAGLCSNSLASKSCKNYMKEYMGLQMQVNYIEDIAKYSAEQLKKYESGLHSSKTLKTKTNKKTRSSKSSVMNPLHK